MKQALFLSNSQTQVVPYGGIHNSLSAP